MLIATVVSWVNVSGRLICFVDYITHVVFFFST